MQKYITPIVINKYIDFDTLLKSSGDRFYTYNNKGITQISFQEIYDYKYLMIVAEPGHGKTRLLKELVIRGNDKNIYFIDTKKITTTFQENIKKAKKISSDINEDNLLKESIFSNTDEKELGDNSTLCLDALDELPFDKIESFFDIIEKFIEEYPNVKVIISCRTHHLKRLSYNLEKLPFEYIILDRFSKYQVIEYIDTELYGKITTLNSSKFDELLNFLEIPRYLYYFCKLLESKKIEDVLNLSRFDLFDHFIYRKLDEERANTATIAKYDIVKRVLEIIALIMKIHQVSEISKDELLTIFGSLNSNFSQIIAREDIFEILYNKSILKDNIDSIEFENQEFLDFLAAKEISRFENIEQVFFDLGVEKHLEEVYKEWFYLLPFLFDKEAKFIEVMVNFLEKNKHKVLRKSYFIALIKVDSIYLDNRLKSKIFSLIFEYHNDHNKWLHIEELIYFYIEEEHYEKIIDSVDKIKFDDEELYVKRNNVVEIIRLLIMHNKLNGYQINYWKSLFLKWLRLSPKKHQVLHLSISRAAANVAKDDYEWMKKIYFIFEKGIEVQYEYARSCFKIDSDNQFSIDVYFKANEYFKKNKVTSVMMMEKGLSYIFKLKTIKGIEYSLKKLLDKDERKLRSNIRVAFKDIYSQPDVYFDKYISSIKSCYKKSVLKYLKQFTYVLFNDRIVNGNENMLCLKIKLIEFIMEKDNCFVLEYIQYQYNQLKQKKVSYYDLLYSILDSFISYISLKVFDSIHTELLKFNILLKDMNTDINQMMYILQSKDNLDNKVVQRIRSIYKLYINKEELGSAKIKRKHLRDEKNRQLGLFKQWEHKIEPEPGMYITDLFEFFISNKAKLLTYHKYEEKRQITIDKAKDIIKGYNPLDGEIKTTGSSSTISSVQHYYDCIKLLDIEEVTIEDNDILDNIFRYLPFAYNSKFERIFKLVPNPSTSVISEIMDVYAGKRDDDLKMHSPYNFIEFLKKFPIIGAEEILFDMIKVTKIKEYWGTQIVRTIPKTFLTKEKIKDYINIYGQDDPLYEEMLSCLIKNYNDIDAIEKTLILIKDKAKNTKASNSRDSYFGSTLDRSDSALINIFIRTDYNFEKNEELLILAKNLRAKNKRIGAQFLEDIVFNNLQYMKTKKSFEPLHKIEDFLQKNQDTNLQWFEYKFVDLKEEYLESLAKPRNIKGSIKRYNKLNDDEYLIVKSPQHLLELVKDSLVKDIKHWVEIDGYYKQIVELSQKKDKRNAEDFIQKTLVQQIELALMKRGLRSTDIRIKREEQSIDDKRADITISYGFIGSILLELKLDSNPEAIVTQQKGKDYSTKLNKYVMSSKSDYGIFLIFNVYSTEKKFDTQIKNLLEYYKDEETIDILGINCISKL